MVVRSASQGYFHFKKTILIYIILFFLFEKAALAFGEDNLYDDPGILCIYTQHRILEKITPELKKEIEDFTSLSAHNQQKNLEHFRLIQDQLEQEYETRKTTLANNRLAKYGLSSVASLAVPFLFVVSINNFLPEDSRMSYSALPFLIMQGSSFFFFKFLEVLSQRYIASSDGAIREYEIKYIRNKPLFEPEFCQVFEGKLVAAHKDSTNIYSYIKWLNAATHLPISKTIIPVDRLNKNFKHEFSFFPQNIHEKIRMLCFRHITQQTSRVIAYFHGPSGTGKTSCARSIAHCLGIPFASIALANYSVSDLVRQGGTHMPSPGKFAEAMLNAKDKNDKTYTNMVFLIDEVDNVLNGEDESRDNNGLSSFLLTFLDPETESYYNPYFEKNIRIKDMLIILGGMKPLKKEAIKKRLIDIEFAGFEPKYKKEYIIDQYIPTLFNNTQEPYRLDIKEHFTMTDKEKISEFIEEDKDPGLRSVQERARQFVDEKIIEVFLKEHASKE